MSRASTRVRWGRVLALLGSIGLWISVVVVAQWCSQAHLRADVSCPLTCCFDFGIKHSMKHPHVHVRQLSPLCILHLSIYPFIHWYRHFHYFCTLCACVEFLYWYPSCSIPPPPAGPQQGLTSLGRSNRNWPDFLSWNDPKSVNVPSRTHTATPPCPRSAVVVEVVNIGCHWGLFSRWAMLGGDNEGPSGLESPVSVNGRRDVKKDGYWLKWVHTVHFASAFASYFLPDWNILHAFYFNFILSFFGPHRHANILYHCYRAFAFSHVSPSVEYLHITVIPLFLCHFILSWYSYVFILMLSMDKMTWP